MKRFLTPLFSLCLVFALIGPAQADLTFVTQRASLGGNDFVDWGTLGAAIQPVNNPFDIVSNLGLSMTVDMTQAGYSFSRVDQWSGAGTFTGWDGNFAIGDKALWTGYEAGYPPVYHHGPMTIVFANPVSGAGAQIQANEPGTFIATIEAYDPENNSLGSFQADGIYNTNRDNSAIFIGVKSDTANIAKLVFNVTQVSPPPFMGDLSFAVNRLDLICTGLAPDNPGIQNGAVDVSVRPLFTWQAVYGAAAYDLYLWKEGGTKPATPALTDITGAAAFLAGPLAPLTQYRWQVVARKASGEAAGPVWTFTTGYILAGDVNDDKALNLEDAILALQAVVGRNPAGIRADYAPSGADVNSDGKVGLADAIYILQTNAALREDTVPPTVSASVPVNNATQVPVEAAIAATFSEAMDAATLTASTFTLEQGTASVPGVVSYNAATQTATFTPSEPLDPAAVYTAAVGTGAKDLAGNALAASHIFGFSTEGMPEVTGTSPMNGDTYVSIDYPSVQIEFASDMDGDSLAQAFTLSAGAGSPVAGTLTYSLGELPILRFVPDSPFTPYTTYTGTLSTTAKSAAGVPLPAAHSFSFTTREGPQWNLSVGNSPNMHWMHAYGQVTDSLERINCGGVNTTCTASYDVGYTVTLTASPAPGGRFLRWVGDDCSSQDQSVSLTRPKNVGASCSANFEPNYDETITLNVTYGSWITRVYDDTGYLFNTDPRKIDCGTDIHLPSSVCSYAFQAGSGHALRAQKNANSPAGTITWTCTSNDLADPPVQSQFTGERTPDLTMNRNKDCHVELVVNP